MTQEKGQDPASKKGSLSYKAAGVDIEAGDALVDAIKPHARSTFRPEVLTGLGGFGALFEFPREKYRQPILVSGTDGVGTKLKLAIDMDRHDSIGIDLVAMCVNDVVVQGAEPLFFLDYFATGQLRVEHGEAVVSGIAEGCRQAGCALIGGETAEMPGMYQHGDYDLAGFCVGVVEKSGIIDGSAVASGDVLVGLGASGPHSNGYSLIRKVIQTAGASLEDPFGATTLGEALLKPTRIYVKTVLSALESIPIHAIAHITGGGLPGNVIRVLPEGVRASIDTKSWEWPEIFKWLQTNGNIDTAEMLRTFNCGIGMVLVTPAEQAENLIALCRDAGEQAFIIGNIEAAAGEAEVQIR